MTKEEFINQMGRLSRHKSAWVYSEELARMIWQASNSLTDVQFSRVIDTLIATRRDLPLLTEFNNAISEVRERAWTKEKKELKKEDSWETMEASVFHPDEQSVMFEVIKKRIRREVSDEQFESFKSDINKTLKAKGIT